VHIEISVEEICRSVNVRRRLFSKCWRRNMHTVLSTIYRQYFLLMCKSTEVPYIKTHKVWWIYMVKQTTHNMFEKAREMKQWEENVYSSRGLRNMSVLSLCLSLVLSLFLMGLSLFLLEMEALPCASRAYAFTSCPYLIVFFVLRYEQKLLWTNMHLIIHEKDLICSKYSQPIYIRLYL